MIGKQVSHYRIVEHLGCGGMGKVFLAEDTTLGRRVALKFLPDDLTTDREITARFEREARVLASLNHPNIATIHGFEEVDSKRFIVMELAEGETLADRLQEGALPVAEVLAIGSQIAEGLAAAHDKGVIHRDLKPANIMVSGQDNVKILDFGLARIHTPDSVLTRSYPEETVTAAMTRQGAVLGTAPYMSPEQANGCPVDRRTDVWAFGCVLYECLTGERAFAGETVTEVTAAILRDEPNWDAIPPQTPATVFTMLRRCLRKDVNQRLRDVGDARLEIIESEVQLEGSVPSGRRFTALTVAFLVVAAVLVGSILNQTLWRSNGRPAAAPIINSNVAVNPGLWLDGMRRTLELHRPSRTALAIASDARFIVYCASAADSGDSPTNPRLYIRHLDLEEAEPIVGTEGGINPFLSPDNRWIGFWAGGKLKKVPVEGGIATPLCDAKQIFGASWGPNGIVFVSGDNTGIMLVSAEGGTPRSLITPDHAQGEYSLQLPHWLPDGQHVLITTKRDDQSRRPGIAVLSLATGEWRPLLPDAADARYLPSGLLVFLRRGLLMGARFDPVALEVVGDPIALVENIAHAFSTYTTFNTAAGQFDISRTGWLVYAAGGVLPDKQRSLVWVDRSGSARQVTNLKKYYFAPRLSPDGRKIAYATFGSESHIWIYDKDTNVHSALTHGSNDLWPVWTPDGTHIIFSRPGSGVATYWRPYDGSKPEELLAFETGTRRWASSCSGDGKKLALVEFGRETGHDIITIDFASRTTTPFLCSPFDEWSPEFSPDGRVMAYTSDESGRAEIYIQPFPGREWKRQVSSDGGVEPVWSADGGRIYYRWENQVWVASIQRGNVMSAGKPIALCEYGDANQGAPIRNWDVAADEQRFLFVKNEHAVMQPLTEIILVQNWAESIWERFPPLD